MPRPLKRHTPTEADGRPVKITLGQMRAMGVRGVLVYCANYRCGHSVALSADQWSDEVRLSDLESRFTCQACSRRGADVRPHFDWNTPTVPAMGYR
nr:hypothetical protein [Bradyrhizobium sp. AS23.2]